jgi:hypothetical protein
VADSARRDRLQGCPRLARPHATAQARAFLDNMPAAKFTALVIPHLDARMRPALSMHRAATEAGPIRRHGRSTGSIGGKNE